MSQRLSAAQTEWHTSIQPSFADDSTRPRVRSFRAASLDAVVAMKFTAVAFLLASVFVTNLPAQQPAPPRRFNASPDSANRIPRPQDADSVVGVAPEAVDRDVRRTVGVSRDDAAGANAFHWPDTFCRDASLYDVQFVDREFGWAVGDRGTILHTRDGGRNWHRQSTRVNGRLESIHFIDRANGWVVGGHSRRHTNRAVGIVLKTTDGGESWQIQEGSFLPWLRGVRFDNAKHGYAFGAPSPMYPSGLFSTDDGGAHWRPITGQSVGWVDGEIDRRGVGRLVDRRGFISGVSPGSFASLGRVEGAAGRQPLCLQKNSDGSWFVCGSQGLLLNSSGDEWNAPRNLPPSTRLDEYDWLATDSHGTYRWVVGSPGTSVLVSSDEGRSWSTFATQHELPIHAIEFVDRQHGWMVGSLGTILATEDGGKTWTYQQGSKRRLAAMGVFGHPADIPWKTIAQLAANDGHYFGLEVLADNATTAESAGLAIRLQEATIAAGGVTANLVPAPLTPAPKMHLPSAAILDAWRTKSEAANAQLIAYLVRQIRIWKPDLIVLAEPTEQDGLAEITQRLVVQATELAADPNRYSAQISAGLSAWRVNSVTTITSDSSQSGYRVNGNRFVQTLSMSVDQLARRSAEYFDRPSLGWGVHTQTSGDSIIRTLNGQANGLFADAAGRNDDAKPGRGAINRTRRPRAVADTEVQERSQRFKRQRNLATILRGARAGQPGIWQQTLHLASRLPLNDRVEVFSSAAQYDVVIGNYGAAHELWRLIERDAPTHELAEATRLRRLWFSASAEVTRHWTPASDVPTATRVRQAGEFTQQDGRVRPATFLDQTDEATPMRKSAMAKTDRKTQIKREVEKLVREIQTQQPDLYFEGQLRFPLAAFQARTGELDRARRFWKSQLSGQTSPAFRSLAASELALLKKNAVNPRRTWPCVRVKRAPHLDGQFDDPMWAEAEAQTLTPTLADKPTTTVRLAYDPEFLYLAVECETQAECHYSDADEPRQRDQPLTEDRLELYLDIDRDTVTFWRMAIDHRGWATESLNHDVTWNPKWYIARQADANSWRIEAAIPLTELSVDPVMPATAWSIGVQRIIPGVDWETWIQPGPVEERPQEFGLLLFQ